MPGSNPDPRRAQCQHGGERVRGRRQCPSVIRVQAAEELAEVNLAAEVGMIPV
jgi:hypothetical protein